MPPHCERIPVILDVPDELRLAVRTTVCTAMGELTLGKPDSPILVPERDIARVMEVVTRSIEGAEVVDGRVADEPRKIIRVKSEPEASRADDNPPVPAATPSTDKSFPRIDLDDRDDPAEPFRHHIDGSWQRLRSQESDARNLVRRVNRPRRGRYSRHAVTVNMAFFHYRGETMSVTNDNGRIVTRRALEAWMREINSRKGR